MYDLPLSQSFIKFIALRWRQMNWFPICLGFADSPWCEYCTYCLDKPKSILLSRKDKVMAHLLGSVRPISLTLFFLKVSVKVIDKYIRNNILKVKYLNGFQYFYQLADSAFDKLETSKAFEIWRFSWIMREFSIHNVFPGKEWCTSRDQLLRKP